MSTNVVEIGASHEKVQSNPSGEVHESAITGSSESDELMETTDIDNEKLKDSTVSENLISDLNGSSVFQNPNENSPVEKVIHPKNVNELSDFFSDLDRNLSCFISSNVPEICLKEPCILGIDEAGRGPVLGPMVYGVAYCPKAKEDDLKETGCADSKSLTEEKRETIFDKMCVRSDYIGWEVEVIAPSVISCSMLRRQKVSLNEVSHNSAIGLVKRALASGVRLSEVFVDTVGPPEKYQRKLKEIFPELEITVAKKADSSYPIVGAASICAKVTRDVAIRTWGDQLAASGSGYPNDPVTKKFLTSTMDPIFGFSNIVRFSWSTAEKVLEENAVPFEWEEEDETYTQRGGGVSSYFSPSSSIKHRRHVYFRDRALTSLTSLTD